MAMRGKLARYSNPAAFQAHLARQRRPRGEPLTVTYLLVRTRQSFVFVNFVEPERTRALYDEAARLWPERTRGAQ